MEALGRDACAQVNEMYVKSLIYFCYVSLTTHGRADSVPRWRGLNHFGTYLSVDFTDGTKWEDMSKVCHRHNTTQCSDACD